MKIPGVQNKQEAETLLKEKWIKMSTKHKAFFTKVVIFEISLIFFLCCLHQLKKLEDSSTDDGNSGGEWVEDVSFLKTLCLSCKFENTFLPCFKN